MSGAPGHIQHLYEDGTLTFGELKEVLRQAVFFKEKQVTEKLDGMNLVFTWDLMAEAGRELRVARSVGDIKHGGMGATELAKKFEGRRNIEPAFNAAFKVLNDTVNTLPSAAKFQAFGPSGQVWYSIEVIYAPEPNVINYDTNAIVFHSWPVFEERLGTVVQREAPQVIDTLTRYIEQMQKAVTVKDWKVCGPNLVNLKKLTDGTALKEALHTLDSAQSCFGLTDNVTLNNYLLVSVAGQQELARFMPNVRNAVAARVVGAQGAPTLHDIRKMVYPSQYPAISDFVKRGPALVKTLMHDIELSMLRFSAHVLKGIQSMLVSDVGAEVSRIKAQVQAALDAIRNSNNGEALDLAIREVNRLGTLDNISTTVEGVVFLYKGKAYKFTGSFASINQILALCKYGRKGIPPIPMGGK